MAETVLLSPGGATEDTLAAVEVFARVFRSSDDRPNEETYAQTVSASGVVITPSSGMRLQINKIGWLAQDAPNSLLLRFADVGSGVRNIWKAVATQQTIRTTGAVNQPIEVVLANVQPVDLNIHYEQV